MQVFAEGGQGPHQLWGFGVVRASTFSITLTHLENRDMHG